MYTYHPNTHSLQTPHIHQHPHINEIMVITQHKIDSV